MPKSVPKIDTWFRNDTEEMDMEPDHLYLWQHFIESAAPQDLSQKTILDYGCNRGGFLETLYRQRPFAHGVGVDVAKLSLAYAQQRCTGLPTQFCTPNELHLHANTVNIAFSHEVVYLLPDLQDHARTIEACLKSGGTYFMAIGCHTDNPLWTLWKGIIAETTNLPTYDYSLDDYARAFWNEGFAISMRPFAYDGFTSMKKENAYFPSVADSIAYHTRHKMIIAARKK